MKFHEEGDVEIFFMNFMALQELKTYSFKYEIFFGCNITSAKNNTKRK